MQGPLCCYPFIFFKLKCKEKKDTKKETLMLSKNKYFHKKMIHFSCLVFKQVTDGQNQNSGTQDSAVAPSGLTQIMFQSEIRSEWLHCTACNCSCHYCTYLLSYSVTHNLSDTAFNFICCGVWSPLPCPYRPLPCESTKRFYWLSRSVPSGGILHVGTMLLCCWQRREAERIIPDDKGIKCVAGRWRPELMLSCLFWFSTGSEAVTSKLSGSSQYSERCGVH